MSPLLWLPFASQALLMLVDELHFHRARGLPTWEIWGHPTDTLTTLGCVLFLLNTEPTEAHAWAFAALASFSALFATKDEAVHLRNCKPGEQWVHSVLFLLHPTVFFASGLWWWNRQPAFALVIQATLTAGFLLFQLAFWGIPWLLARRDQAKRSTPA
jgi:hypothetical protein